MIVEQYGGYALRCTGCGAVVELRRSEVNDAHARLERRDAMKQIHAACDGYGNPRVAAAAIKLQRERSRQAER